MKLRKVGNRGTKAYEKDVGPQNWAGDAYREYELDHLNKIKKNLTLHLGRGTRTAKKSDLPEPLPRPSTEGMTRIMNRGTAFRKSRNKGTRFS